MLLPILFLTATGFMVPMAARPATRATTISAGLFDGVKDAFGKGDTIVDADRVTPFDRWLGNDKELRKENTPDESAAYIDPSDAANYMTFPLSKPMGIAFVENEGGCGGAVCDQVLDEGSAASSPLRKGDQLVGVDGTLVLGKSLEECLDSVGAAGFGSLGPAPVKLTFFRGPTAFLYGPTQPEADWYEALLK